jgi:hypothetical protein
MATYQLSNTATQINNFLTGYIHKDSTNIFDPSKDSFVCAGTDGSGWARMQLTDNNF